MYSKGSTGRVTKGSVAVLSSNGRLQLRFHYEGRRHYLSTGYPDTPEHRKLAEIKAKEIDKDILYERFDPNNLDKYKPKSALSTVTPVTPIAPPQRSLAELWEKYTEFKRPSLSPSTLAKDFVKIRRCIDIHLPTQSIGEAVAIRDWLIANRTPNAAKRVLTQLTACCDWAMKSQLISENPFDGMAADIKIPKGASEETDINPFSLEERNQIIEAFKSDQYYKFYAPLIEFLFLTGCRPSEAIALQWQHISSDYRSIRFEQAVVISEHGLVCKKGLKTQKKRVFPANARLAALLASIKPAEATGETKIFPSPEGGWIDVHNLTNRAWRSVLAKLNEIKYRKLYQTRHTFITAALETALTTPDGKIKMLDAKDVAKLVGTSPEMIYQHYAGQTRELFVPEF
jgi:integrase